MSFLQKLLAGLTGKVAPPPATGAPVSAPAPVVARRRSPVSTNPRIFERDAEPLVALDDQLAADIRVSLVGCSALKSLPAGLTTGSLDLAGCTAIETLPDGIDVAFLDLADCTALRALPADLRLRGGRLNLRNCTQVSELPADMGSVAQLDLQGCTRIEALPEGLEVTSWIDIGGSGIDRLPARLAHVDVRRHGESVASAATF